MTTTDSDVSSDDDLDPIELLTRKTAALTTTIHQEREAQREANRLVRRSNRLTAAGIAVVVVGVLAVFGVTSDTNDAVNHEIARQDRTIVQQEAVINQAVGVITQQLVPQIVELGGTPPLIELKPPDTDLADSGDGFEVPVLATVVGLAFLLFAGVVTVWRRRRARGFDQ